MRILKGFTLIELLVVISIIGVLASISIFGINGARITSRDAKRQADLEQIRSGLELYRADCGAYPASLGTSLVGSGSPSSCSASNVYISSVPTDPTSSTRRYSYTYTAATNSYTLCASLENGTGSVSGCGSCTTTCNYKVTNP